MPEGVLYGSAQPLLLARSAGLHQNVKNKHQIGLIWYGAE